MRLPVFALVRCRLARPAVACLLCLALGACAYSTTNSRPGPASGRVPQPGDAICVAVAKDPPGSQSASPEPGRSLSTLTLDIVKDRFPETKLVESNGETEAIKRCRDDGVRYLLVPAIIDWGNTGSLAARFTESVSVDLRLLFVPTKQVVTSVRYRGSNNSVTIGSHLPEALTDENYRDAVMALFQRP